MNIALIVVGAVVCVGLASAASHSPKQLRMVLDAKRRLDKKAGRGPFERRCFGAKCDCDDMELLQAFVGTMGNLVASCEIFRLWDLLAKEGEPQKKQEFNFYEEGCKFMEQIGAEYESGADPEIFTCCDVTEALVAFHCLNTYMSIAEMAFAKNAVEGAGGAAPPAQLVTDLEMGMKFQCNAVFKSPDCLVLGMTENPQVAQCFKPADAPTAAPETNKPERTINDQIEALLKSIKKYN